MLSVRKGPFLGSQSTPQPPSTRRVQGHPTFCQPLLALLTFQTRGSGLTPSVGSAGSEGTRLQALLHQPPTSSPRVGWAVHLLIQKQNLDALGLT